MITACSRLGGVGKLVVEEIGPIVGGVAISVVVVVVVDVVVVVEGVVVGVVDVVGASVDGEVDDVDGTDELVVVGIFSPPHCSTGVFLSTFAQSSQV